MSKGIVFYSFQSITKKGPSGMVKYVLPLLQNLHNLTSTPILYKVGRIKAVTKLKNVIPLNRYYTLSLRTINLFNKFIFKLPSYKIRYYTERLYDYFASVSLNKPQVIISTAYLLRTTKKNKKLGGINIFLAGNPDDIEINALLKNEKQKHNIDFQDAYTFLPRINFIKNSIDTFDHIVTITISEFESYSKRISQNRISFQPNLIIPSKRQFQNQEIEKCKKLKFCFVAYPFWLKGLNYLLDAWSKVDSDEIVLEIAGNSNDELQKILNKKFPSLKNVEYLGYVEDLNNFLRSSHVCIVPSLLDAGPTTVAEAMICGLPVIVSDGCGSRTLVKEGINGFVVQSGNSTAIYEKITWFIENQSKISVMGMAAEKTIQELQESNQDRKLAEHIVEIINILTNK